MSLERMKDLEEQVKAIPMLQVSKYYLKKQFTIYVKIYFILE